MNSKEKSVGSENDLENSSGKESHQKQKSPFTPSKKFNIEAPPFQPPKKTESHPHVSSVVRVGPSSVPINGNVWKMVANNRVFPDLPQTVQSAEPRFRQATYASMNLFNGYPLMRSQFEDNHSRNIVFTRAFGPVAHPDGFVELRLKENINVLITIDRSLLVLNPNSKVKIAVASSMHTSAMEHPNGKIFQQFDRIDILAYDGTKKLNNHVRYAKMWEKGISLTADGCALIYLVDSAGTRTTSDAVNKDYRIDYCWKVFANNVRLGGQFFNDADAASKNYHFFTQDDGTQVFEILGFRVSQTIDGMVRVCRSNNRLKIHTSPTNGSATLTTPSIHCTASMGQSSHLFVRHDERRMHFDGSSFVVRNAGHSSGFDDQNNLRVY